MEETTEITQVPAPPTLPNRRILATSARGDQVWQICQPVLEFLITNGDETAQAQAIKTRAYWEQEQQWLIDLLNNNHYFTLAEHAMRNPREFKKALVSLPPCTGMQVDFWPDKRTEEPVKV